MALKPRTAQIQLLRPLNQVFVLRFLQGRNPDWVQRPFFARYDEKAVWMDELKPAFGDSFFFEAEEENLYGERYHDSFPDDFE